jgi:hypothetical protein
MQISAVVPWGCMVIDRDSVSCQRLQDEQYLVITHRPPPTMLIIVLVGIAFAFSFRFKCDWELDERAFLVFFTAVLDSGSVSMHNYVRCCTDLIVGL